MLRSLKMLATALALLVWAGAAMAQTLPIPQGMCTANQILYASDIDTAKCTSTPSVTTGTFSTSVSVGSSATAITQIRVFSTTASPTSIAAATCEDQELTVSGLAATDKLIVNAVYAEAGSLALIRAFSSTGANTLVMRYCNLNPGGAATPTAGTVNIVAIRS